MTEEDKELAEILARISGQLERVITAMERHAKIEEKRLRCPSCSGDGKGYDNHRCVQCAGTGLRATK